MDGGWKDFVLVKFAGYHFLVALPSAPESVQIDFQLRRLSCMEILRIIIQVNG